MPTSTPGDETASETHPGVAAAAIRALSGFPRVDLATLPTPLEPMARLQAELGGAGTGPELWVKRDDLTGLALGGNKVRKLEYLLGAARAEGADTIITFGALQSNHARQTAADAPRTGLDCELILTRAVGISGDAYERSGNLMLDRLLGATCTVVDHDDDLLGSAVEEVSRRVRARGGRAYWVPPGGSNAVGTMGYVRAGIELAGQTRAQGIDLTDVVLAASTGGTHAGLLTGLRMAGCRARVRGVDVYRTKDRTLSAVAALTAEIADLLDRNCVGDDEIHLTDDFLGPGYGLPTEEMLEALSLVARTEGLLLDPVYSGKAMAFLVAGVRTGLFDPGAQVVFLHTGGAPGLFAYADTLTRTPNPPNPPNS